MIWEKSKKFTKFFGGYINKSFGVYTVKDGERHTWFFRKYMRHKDLNELMMEHKLLLHARANGFTKGRLPSPAAMVAPIMPQNKKNGRWFL